LRAGIIADVHGNIHALEASWRILTQEGVDIVLNLGDLVHFGPCPDECISFVREHGIESLQGNCDRAVARGRATTGDDFVNVHWTKLASLVLAWTRSAVSPGNLAWLRRLPEEMRFEVGRRTILAVHGLPGRIATGLHPHAAVEVYDVLLERAGASVLAVAHTHSPALVSRTGGWIVNPGSLGGGTLPSAGTAAILEFDDRGCPAVSWLRVDYDFRAYAEACGRSAIPEIFRRCIELGRDPRGKWHTRETAWRQKWAAV
jgi:putative phosphoesterase